MKRTFQLKILAFALILFMCSKVVAQKVGYIASQAILERWSEHIQADQRIKSLQEDWSRQYLDFQKEIDEIELDIKKNRLIWSVEEKVEKENTLQKKITERLAFASRKFNSGGEFDATVAQIYKPVQEKLYLAVQDVSASEGFDIVIDKSTQPVPYVNPKYDLTVKVMKKLNIPADDLEEKQKKAIEEDPRNKKEDKTSTSSVPRKRSRTESTDEIKPDMKPQSKP